VSHVVRGASEGSNMTKKHFEKAASIVRSYEPKDKKDVRQRAVALAFAELFETEPRFDRARFLEACGVREGLSLAKQ
jgi:hypothetical protein